MLNRERRRKFIKEAKAKGVPKEYIDAYITMLEGKNDGDLVADGMKVMLDVDHIKNSKSYGSMNERYKEFVEQSRGKVFTAKLENSGLVYLEESPEWLFWEGDLVKCKEGDSGGCS